MLEKIRYSSLLEVMEKIVSSSTEERVEKRFTSPEELEEKRVSSTKELLESSSSTEKLKEKSFFYL